MLDQDAGNVPRNMRSAQDGQESSGRTRNAQADRRTREAASATSRLCATMAVPAATRSDRARKRAQRDRIGVPVGQGPRRGSRIRTRDSSNAPRPGGQRFLTKKSDKQGARTRLTRVNRSLGTGQQELRDRLAELQRKAQELRHERREGLRMTRKASYEGSRTRPQGGSGKTEQERAERQGRWQGARGGRRVRAVRLEALRDGA